MLGLSLITLGIYSVVWYYRIHKELLAYGLHAPPSSHADAVGRDEELKMLRAISPGTSLLAITLGGLLIVPPFVSAYRSFDRIKSAQIVAGVTDRVSSGLGFFLFVVEALTFFFFSAMYAQSHLNRVWRAASTHAARRLAEKPPVFTG